LDHPVNISSLELRRLHLDLIVCYKIVFGLICVNSDDFSHLVLYPRQEDTRINCINQDVRTSQLFHWQSRKCMDRLSFYSKFLFVVSFQGIINKKAVLSQGNRAMPQLLFGLKFADNIHNKFNSSQASKAMPQSSKHSGAKQNLTQNGHSR